MAVTDEFAEKLGTALATFLLWPPMAGRISAQLMTSSEPLTLTELQERLDASGGAVSEGTRLLLTTGVIRRIKTLGVRRAQYEWAPDAWVNCAKHFTDQMAQLRELAASTGAMLGGSDLFHERLHEMEKYYKLMTHGVAQLADAYEAEFLAEQSSSGTDS